MLHEIQWIETIGTHVPGVCIYLGITDACSTIPYVGVVSGACLM